VLQRVLERVPATLELVLAGSAVALLLALPLGLLAATRVWGARVSRLVTTVGVSVPVFWLGLLLQLLLAMQLGWLPSSGRQSFGSTSVADRLVHLVLPALVLAAVQGAAWTRYLQRAMGDTLALPFVHAGRVRGLSEARLVWRHALPNALGPFVTVVLLDAAMLASGAVVTESVFAWPGVGSLFTEALVKRDYPVLMAFLMVGAVTVIVLNLLADLAVARLDPRTREAT
jgi:peptide/nickel transport system permease protein